jgi:hypothetical protein
MMMDSYRLSVWLHILFGIVLSGQALFWTIMHVALHAKFDATEARQWLMQAKGARWPHVVVPYALRLPLPLVAWATFAVLVVSGVLLVSMTREPAGLFWSIKLGLVAGLVLVQIVLTWRPVAWAVFANMLLTLATMIVSAWLVRG